MSRRRRKHMSMAEMQLKRINREQHISGHYFMVPNELFQLELHHGEIALYCYLMYCEDRDSFKCTPKFSTIGAAIHMSRNTVMKYVHSLEEKQLIQAKWTYHEAADGTAHNGSLEYTILPIQCAIDHHNRIRLERGSISCEKSKMLKKAKKLGVTIVPNDESA